MKLPIQKIQSFDFNLQKRIKNKEENKGFLFLDGIEDKPKNFLRFFDRNKMDSYKTNALLKRKELQGNNNFAPKPNILKDSILDDNNVIIEKSNEEMSQLDRDVNIAVSETS